MHLCRIYTQTAMLFRRASLKCIGVSNALAKRLFLRNENSPERGYLSISHKTLQFQQQGPALAKCGLNTNFNLLHLFTFSSCYNDTFTVSENISREKQVVSIAALALMKEASKWLLSSPLLVKDKDRNKDKDSNIYKDKDRNKDKYRSKYKYKDGHKTKGASEWSLCFWSKCNMQARDTMLLNMRLVNCKTPRMQTKDHKSEQCSQIETTLPIMIYRLF